MNDELVERLRAASAAMRSHYAVGAVELIPTWTMDGAADEIERLTAEVKRLDHSTIHTCWDECPRLACVQRREIEALTAKLAHARQEGWNAAIEAAVGICAKRHQVWRKAINTSLGRLDVDTEYALGAETEAGLAASNIRALAIEAGEHLT